MARKLMANRVESQDSTSNIPLKLNYPQMKVSRRCFMKCTQGYLMFDEQNPDKLYDAATALKEAGDMQGAVDALLKIIETEPNHLQTNMALGVYLQKLGRIEEAIKHAVKVTEIEPNDAFSFTQLSVIYQRCNRIPEAEDAMAKAHVIQGRPASTGQPDTSKHSGA